MSESRYPSFEVAHNGNRELVVNSGQLNQKIDFSQPVLGLAGPDYITSKSTKVSHSTI